MMEVKTDPTGLPVLDQNENAMAKGTLNPVQVELSSALPESLLPLPKRSDPDATASTLSSLSSHSESESSEDTEESDDSYSVGSLDSSVEMVLLVSKNIKVFRELPSEEMAHYQRALASLASCKMECLVCGMNFDWDGKEDSSILDHVRVCCSSVPVTREDFSTSIRSSAFYSIKALAEALLASEYCEDDSEEDESSGEQEDLEQELKEGMVRDLKEVEVEKEERLVVVCEPRFLFGRMAVVFAFPLKATLNDLDAAVQELLDCCWPNTWCLMSEQWRPLPCSEPPLLVDLLATKPLLVSLEDGHDLTVFTIRALGRELVRSAPFLGSLLMTSCPPRLVCSVCEERPALNIQLLERCREVRRPRVSADLLYTPTAFCRTCSKFDPTRMRSLKRFVLPCLCFLVGDLDSTDDTSGSSAQPRDSQDDSTQTCSTCGNTSTQLADCEYMHLCECGDCSLLTSTCSCPDCINSSNLVDESSL